MYSQSKIIMALLDTTKTMNGALKERNLDVLEQMLTEREAWLLEYEKISKTSFTTEEQSMVDEMLLVDKENNDLLEDLYEKSREKVTSFNKNKNEMKKRTNVAKKYLSSGTSVGERSRFNKKT